jgi:hypothetical protein
VTRTWTWIASIVLAAAVGFALAWLVIPACTATP